MGSQFISQWFNRHVTFQDPTVKVSHEPNRSIAEFLNELPCATLTSSIDLPINTKPSVLFPKSSFVRNNLLKEGVAIIFTDSLHVHRPLNLFLMDLQLNLLFRGLIFNELWCSHWISNKWLIFVQTKRISDSFWESRPGNSCVFTARGKVQHFCSICSTFPSPTRGSLEGRLFGRTDVYRLHSTCAALLWRTKYLPVCGRLPVRPILLIKTEVVKLQHNTGNVQRHATCCDRAQQLWLHQSFDNKEG